MKAVRYIELPFIWLFTLVGFILAWIFYPLVIIHKLTSYGDSDADLIETIALVVGAILLIITIAAGFTGAQFKSDIMLWFTLVLFVVYLAVGLVCWLIHWIDWRDRLF